VARASQSHAHLRLGRCRPGKPFPFPDARPPAPWPAPAAYLHPFLRSGLLALAGYAGADMLLRVSVPAANLASAAARSLGGGARLPFPQCTVCCMLSSPRRASMAGLALVGVAHAAALGTDRLWLWQAEAQAVSGIWRFSQEMLISTSQGYFRKGEALPPDAMMGLMACLVALSLSAMLRAMYLVCTLSRGRSKDWCGRAGASWAWLWRCGPHHFAVTPGASPLAMLASAAAG
jgi:hypothetical protein